MKGNSVQSAQYSPVMSTLGTFEFDGRTWAVESHPGDEIWVSVDDQPMAKMFLGCSSKLSTPVPIGGVASNDWLLDLKQWVSSVLAAAAADNRGPWAFTDSHIM